MTGVIMGVDAGTTNIKTVAFDQNGVEVAQSSRSNQILRDGPHEEQNMETTWKRTAATIREVVDSIDEEVEAIGITGQGDGCWLIDKNGKPVRNAILWSDGRAASYVEQWREDGRADRLYDICRTGMFPGASLPILCWLRDNEPEALEQADTIFHCKDWIQYQLTGVKKLDPSDASLPFLNVKEREYAPEVGDIVGLNGIEELLPSLLDPQEIIGTTTAEAERETGLPPGVPVISGCIDIVACAFGSGTTRPSERSSVVGTTSLNQQLISEVDDSDEGDGFTLALWDGLYVRAMASMAGTPNVDWMRDRITDDEDFAVIEDRIKDVPRGSDGILYHPYLSNSGERSPFVKPTARAQFMGLNPSHTCDHLLRAVYEGVALAMRDCFECLPETTDSIRLSGGGAHSDFWCQLFADCLDANIEVPTGKELGAKGVAMLAGVAVDWYEDIDSATVAMTGVDRIYEPRPEAVEEYDIWYEAYKDIYENMFAAWDRREQAHKELREQHQ